MPPREPLEEGANSADTLISDFRSPDLGENQFLLFEAPHSVAHPYNSQDPLWSPFLLSPAQPLGALV